MRRFTCILTLLMLLPLLSSCVQTKHEETVSQVNISGKNDTTVFPVIQGSVVSDKEMKIRSVKIRTFTGADDFICNKLRTVLEKHGIKEEADAQVTLYIGSDASQMSKYLSAFDTFIDDIEQGYTLCAGGNMIVLGGVDADGLYYAIVTLDALIRDNKVKECVIRDYPKIKERGVIEGFYGEPWSHEDRLSIIDFMGKMKLNTYIYAPKDDLKHRDNWREPYNEEELKRFGELVDRCRENNVKFVFAVSPGKDFNYNNPDEDYKALEEKCRTLSDIGVKNFAIFLDDLNKNMQNAEGHASLLNRFQSEFCGDTPLITVFSEYYEEVITDRYTGKIAELLDKRIKVMWTGNAVVPESINQSDLNHINGIYDRKMMIWWNYPVNDYAPNNLFIGPAVRLDQNLSGNICGFIANPMNQAEASKIPLFTMADYVWNPQSYKADSSYDAALKALHPETADALKKLFAILSGNVINKYTDSTEYKQLFDMLRNINVENRKTKETAGALITLFEELLEAIDEIHSKEENKNFLEEISPWIEKAKSYAEKALPLLEALQKSDDDREASYKAYIKYLELAEKVDDNPAVVSERVIAPAFKEMEKLLSTIYTSDAVLTSFLTSIVWENASISTSISPPDKNFTIENAVDNDFSTYFLGNGACVRGTYVMLDLGEVTDVHNIYLHSAAYDHKDDYFHAGQMQYSQDGENWTNVGELQTEPIVFLDDLNIKARYIRYTCTEDQDYQLYLSGFYVNYKVNSSNVSVTPEGMADRGTDKLFDCDFSTYYTPVRTPQSGEAIIINIKNIQAKKLEIYQQTIAAAEVTVCLSDGSEKAIGKLDNNYFSAEIPQNTVIIKITWVDNSIVPEINEIIFK